MSLPRPFHWDHFQADLIWPDGPFKRTLTRDFWLQVFFMNQFLQGSWIYHGGHFELVFHRRCQGIDENPEHGLITGVNDTGNNLSFATMTQVVISPVSLTPVNSLLPVSMTPAIDTKSLKIFIKIRNDPNRKRRGHGGNSFVNKT